MNEAYEKWYREFSELTETFDDDELYSALDSLIGASKNTFAFNKKIMEKAIDVSWVEAIENGLIHVDNFLRQPRRTIEDVEEVVPIALSKKITVESVKHLAQHTDLIQSIDKKTGRITPSKILNVHKEESLLTYENKFVNTLVDRLYIFINTRYEKLAQVAKDEEVFSLGYDTVLDDGKGGKMKVDVRIETIDSLDSYDANGFTVWQRVEKLKKAIEGYKGSELCQTLGSTYIRPPVMRTNAIMKNVDLKACLTLWQYIESYDKVGYEINVQNTAVQPEKDYINDFYKLVALNLLLFRSYMNNDNAEKLKELKAQKSKPMAPKIVKKFDKELAADYSVTAEAVAGYIASDADFKLEKKLPPDLSLMFEQITEVINIESAYIAELEKKRAEEAKIRAEEEERLREQQRIEEARRAELERIRIEKEEEERRVQEMLEQKRAEQEAEERERERLEQERLARLEEIRRREEEERQRQEEERLKREEEERIEAERQRIEQSKEMARAELGEAEGMDEEALNNAPDEEELEKQAYEEVTEEEIAEAKAAMEEASEEESIEDPRAVAARMKLEQQKREKERAETERAQRLKAERQHFESKTFREIYREYSWNPIYVLMRLIRHILAVVFGVIPEDTDNPLYKQLLADKKAKQAQKDAEDQARKDMEVYYRKYGHSLKYDFMRFVSDMKFKRKKRLEQKNKPKPAYTPPVRTPEEQREIDIEMKRLYREYHVNAISRVIRAVETRKREKQEFAEALRQNEEHAKAAAGVQTEETEENTTKISNIIVSIILIISVIFTAYVMINSARGKAVRVFGKSVLKVVTGSMEPSIHVGDYIIVEKTDTDTLEAGDIISFYSEQSDINGLLVTHRIAEVEPDGSFVTKGDANPVTDSVTVRPERIVGKYTGKARFFIWVSTFANIRKILLLAVMITMTVIAMYEAKTVMNIGKKAVEEKAAEAEKQREAAIREAIEAEKRRLEEIGYKAEDEVNTVESGETDEREND
ncbi:MAG: signal peptidase I [Ruminococcus sp.]|nr:signal peptidase I [Ruminococcus sp.]